MQNLSNISVIRDLLTRYGFTFSKALGQNFLINPVGLPPYGQNWAALRPAPV